MLQLCLRGSRTVPYRSVRKMHVQYLPMRWGRGDNYAYLITDESTKDSWLIDPANPEDISEETLSKVNVVNIVNTHHHYDHAGGNDHYKKLLKVPIVGGKDCPSVDVVPQDGEKIQLGSNLEITAIHTPCHTQDSICYYFADNKTGEKAVFTGDTLFTAGCGRFFEGEPSEMVTSLNKLAQLPKTTVVYPGHEYTKGNAKFALSVMDNEPLRQLMDYSDKNEFTTGKYTIEDELAFNPFMRCDDDELKAKFHCSDDIQLMGLFREMKNNF